VSKNFDFDDQKTEKRKKMAGLVLFRSFPLKLDRLTIVSTSKLAFSTNNSEKSLVFYSFFIL